MNSDKDSEMCMFIVQYTLYIVLRTSWLKVNSRNNGTAVKVTREIFCILFLQEHLLLVAVFWGV